MHTSSNTVVLRFTVNSARISARRRHRGCFRAKKLIVALTSICLLYWMFIRARPYSRSLVMLDLKYRVFGRRIVLNDRSHSADEIGNVHKNTQQPGYVRKRIYRHIPARPELHCLVGLDPRWAICAANGKAPHQKPGVMVDPGCIVLQSGLYRVSFSRN